MEALPLMSTGTLIVLALGVLIAVFLAGASLVLRATGANKWNAQISRTAKIMWTLGLLVAFAISFFWLGPAVLLSTWPFWLLTIGVTTVLFLIQDWLSGARSVPTNTTTPTTPTWDALWRAYEHKPLPPWMLEAAMKGDVVYDGGKRATVVNGVLVPKKDSPSLSLEGLFQKLDKYLG